MGLLKFVTVFAFVGLIGSYAVAQEDPSIVVFSRHTFRGIQRTVIGPQRVSLPQFGLDIPLPLLGYGMEATPRGLDIVERFASPALNQATALAFKDLGQAQAFDGRWDEIRPDMSCSRDFYTGLYFKKGLQALNHSPIVMAGVPTSEGKPVDAVPIGALVNLLIPREELAQRQSASPNSERLRVAGDSLLSLIGEVLAKPGPFRLPPMIDAAKMERDPAYAQVDNLASAIEMTAELGPPLELLFPQAPKQTLRKLESEALNRASAYLGIRFPAAIPMELAYASSQIAIRYINAVAPGRRVIVCSHDGDLSSLCRALGLISDEGKADDLVMAPVESIVFAVSAQRVSIVRMRLERAADGSFKGPCASSLLWHGSKAEWDAKVAMVNREADGWKTAAAERAKVQLLTPEILEVLVEPSR